MRKPVLSSLLIAPVLSLALLCPAVAVAAEQPDSAASKSAAAAPAVQAQSAPAPAPQVHTVERGTLTLCDDPFRIEAPAADSTASNPVTPVAAEPAPVNKPAGQETLASSSDDASTMIAAPAATNKAKPTTAAGNTTPTEAAIAPEAQSASQPNPKSAPAAVVRSVAAAPAETVKSVRTIAETADCLPANNESNAVTVAFEKIKALATESSESPRALVAQASSGGIDFFDSHPANVTFRATAGGTVAKGVSDTGEPASAGVASFTEHYQDSLAGVSGGATAITQAGYHFLHWVDTLTGAVVSTSTSYTPVRPESGWPAEWIIEAVFVADIPDTYVVKLDPNLGTAGGGGGSPGVVSIEVKTGSNYRLPLNGSQNVQFSNAGCEFSGWNTLANPGVGNEPGSFVISDGQLLDSATEAGILPLFDWSSGTTPTITLYAQWLAIITYSASKGGSITDAGASTSKTSLLSEKINTSSGARADNLSSVGPLGAKAVANPRYHFAGWQVDGSAKKITDTEANDANLSSSVVTRLSRYADANSATSQYHPLSFTATFAPNTYFIQYGQNGGSGSIESASITYGTGASTTVAETGITRDGYKLTGWNLAPNGSGRSFAFGNEIDSATIDSLVNAGALEDRNNAGITLYAQWTKTEEPNKEDETPTKPSEDKEDPSIKPEPDKDENKDEGNDNGEGGQNDEGDQGNTPVETPSTKPTPSNTGSGNASGWVPAYSNAYYSEPTVTSTLETLQSEQPATEAASSIMDEIQLVENGLLSAAATGKDAASSAPIAARESGSAGGYGSGAASGENAGVLDQLMTPEGMQEASTTVAAVAAVGALASLVGVGVSVAGAAMVGAATIGTASAIGLTSAADLAADLAAAGAAGAAGGAAGDAAAGAAGAAASGAAGAAKKRRRRKKNDAESSREG